MTALPLRDFTAAEQEHLDAIEAAPAAAESLRFRVALAMTAEDAGLEEMDEDGWDYYLDAMQQDDFLRLADAAIAVLRGPSSDADRAVERCLQLADEDDRCVPLARQYGIESATTGEQLYWQVMADVREQSAARIRAAVRGD